MSLPDLTGRVAVVSGASRGLGAGLARVFAEHGMKLGLYARSDSALPDSDDVLARRLDARDERGLQGFVAEVEERFGTIDLWVNNAGVLEPIAPLRDVEYRAFRDHIEINLGGVFLGTRAYVRHLHARGAAGGVLVNISSGAAWKAYRGWAAYCAGKAAVERMTQVVAEEEGPRGLRAYSLAPGVVDTAMQEQIRACPPDRFPEVERFVELKRADGFNSPEFVARHLLAVAFDPDSRPDGVVVSVPDEKG